ncbi:MAG TPA: FAD-dependent oxidoreductase [Firmicutes bacterium]|nr:FAD-dependent oxidoreductase [Bacillota bacterium]
MHFDVVVVGAGLGGLTSALYLANKGKRVAVVEKHHIPGGYATNFKRKGKNGKVYEFDVSLHGIGNLEKEGILYGILENLGVTDEVCFLKKSETATYKTLTNEIDLYDDFQTYKKDLKRRFSDYSEGIEALFSFLKDLSDDMQKVSKEKRSPRYFNQLAPISLDTWLRSYVDYDPFVEEFCTLWLYYGLPPKQLSALYFCLAWIGYHIYGTFYIEGGAQKLSNVYAKKIKEKGGMFFFNQEVEALEVDENQLKKVITKKGTVLTADIFILNGDPYELFCRVKNPNSYTQSYIEKLGQLQVGVSLSQLYIGLDCLPKEIGVKKADYFCIKHTPEQSWTYIQEGNYEKMDFAITNTNAKDPNLNPNYGAIAITIGDLASHWPEYGTEAYREQKEAVSQILLTKAEEFFPGLKEHVTLTELGTPHTMKRYTNNREGAVYGWSQSVTQAGFDRLAPLTSLCNVLLAGSWTQPGGGYEGAITSGYETGKIVDQILEDRGLKKSDPDIVEKEVTQKTIEMFLIGMCEGINRTAAKDLKLRYHFVFNEKYDYYIEVKNTQAKVYVSEQQLVAHATIRVDFNIWKKISFGELSGDFAVRTGELKIEGDMDAFMKIPDLFPVLAPSKTISKQKERTVKAEWLILCTFVPWIFYWAGGHFIPAEMISSVGTIYMVLLLFFIKPKYAREITILEGTTLFAMGLYGMLSAFHILSDTQMTILINGILILVWCGSLMIRKPLTIQYTRHDYPSFVVSSHLFYKINQHITFMWTVIYSVQLFGVLLLPYPFNQLIYLLSVAGLIFTFVYPKQKTRVHNFSNQVDAK